MKNFSTVIQPIGISASDHADKWQFYWLCGLIVSFAYELPLAFLTPYDRTNPRLFDVFVVVGLLTILPKLLKHRTNVTKPFRVWASLVGWFCFCAIVWAITVLPWEYGIHSLWRAAKYIEGLLAIYMATQIPLDARRKHILHGVLVFGGVFVAVYCIPEYVRGATSVIIREDLEVNITEGTLVGPFGASYFQLAQTSALFFACAVTYFASPRLGLANILGTAIVAFLAWPALMSGSRTGLGLILITTATLAIFDKSTRKMFLIVFVVLIPITAAFVDLDRVSNFVETGATLQRFEGFELEDSDNSIAERIRVVMDFSSYMAGDLLPLIGGGFYVAPVKREGFHFAPLISGGELYDCRIDFGIHSIYLFPLEQAGVIGLVLFLKFIIEILRSLWKSRSQDEPANLPLSNALFAYFVATLIVGVGGHNFWQGFDSGNFNTLLITLLLIAITPSREALHRE